MTAIVKKDTTEISKCSGVCEPHVEWRAQPIRLMHHVVEWFELGHICRHRKHDIHTFSYFAEEICSAKCEVGV
jgi:hypothetical protein